VLLSIVEPRSSYWQVKYLRFCSPLECESWLSERQRRRPDVVNDMHVRIKYPSEPYQVFFVAHRIASLLTYRLPVLLFLTEWGIWPSSENWHLYYRLRRSYSDYRLLQEASGHLFLEHEMEDLTSFLHLSMLNGWGGYVLTEANHVNALFSHDEYIDFFSENSANLTEIREEFGPKQQTGGGTTITPH
jgi:hypothetical protein